MMDLRVDQFLKAITGWASSQSNMLALALVGSHARVTARKDSDVDLVLITSQPDRYLDNFDWMQQFGSVARFQKEYYGLVTSIRTWYKDGLEVEYGITDVRWTADPLDEGTRLVITDGCRILFERDGLLSRHL